MKKLCALLLAVCLTMGIPMSAYALENDDPALPEEAETVSVSKAEEATVVVGTLEELQAAIDAAEEGDTIALSQTITVNGDTLSTDKGIKITCADNFAESQMMRVYSGTIIGLTIKGTATYSLEIACGKNSETLIENCTFDGMGTSIAVKVYGAANSTVQIKNCELKNCYGNAVKAMTETNIAMEDCYVHNTIGTDAAGAVQSSGTLALKNCIITQNQAFANAGVMSSGNLSISDCQISGNTITSTDKASAVDIFCSGIWSITDDPHDGAGYYDTASGEKIALPVSECENLARLIYLSDEDAAIYFASDETDDPAEQQPQEPAEDDGDDSESDDTGLHEEPEGGDDDYTPHIWVRPSKPTNRTPPEIKQEPASEPEKASLRCGNAVIDTSRSVVLLGYGDGLLHLEDAITRAQMATVIYRLLDQTSSAEYDSTDTVFSDVAPDTWYCRYVNTIAAAGIVYGKGNGNYSPDAPLTWAHIITVLSRFVEAQDYTLQNIQYDGWATDAVKTAVALDWIEDSIDFAPDKTITRGQFMDLVNGVIARYR